MAAALIRRRLLIAAVSLLLASAALAAGWVGWLYYQGAHPWIGDAQYVALGSSFAAGPGLPPRERRSPLLCAQSARNYPHQIAHDLGLTLIDRSCSGATTEHVLRGGQYFQPPQIDAIGPHTRLVTVTIGGNDAHYLGNLAAETCPSQPMHVRLIASCMVWPEERMYAGLARAQANLRLIAGVVHQRAPRARLVYVGYFRLFPARGSCARLGISAASADRYRALAAALDRVTRDVATAVGARFVDLGALGQGHDICSGDPWLNGAHPEGTGGAPFHPNAAGMTAAARAVEAGLARRRG